MNKALIYIRVSTEEQATSDRHSLQTQLRLCEKAIQDSGQYLLATNGIYSDPGKSATNMRRPGLQDLLLRVQEDKTIKAVFVQDTDRLARNAGDHLTIKAILQKHNVKMISVSQPGIEDTPVGNFMDVVIAGVNQLQSQITGRKTIKSMEQKFWEGGWPTHAPLGYLNVGEKDNDKKRIVTIDPIRGPLIQEAFQLYATGDYSMLAILDLIHEKGFRARNGKRIMLSKFAYMLNNHFYYGEMHWRGLVNAGKHTPLITQGLFERCRLTTKERAHRACRRRKYNFILRGFVKCAICSCRYTAEYHPKKQISYYHCSRYKNNIPGNTKCLDRYVEAHDLENQVQEKFDQLQFSEGFIQKIETRLKIVYESKKNSVASEKNRLLQARIAVENKLGRAEEKLIDGVLNDESYERLKRTYCEQIGNFEEEIARVERSKNIKVDVIQQVLALTRDIGTSYRNANPELKQLYLGLFWHHFEAKERQIVTAIKSPIVLALEEVGAMSRKKLQRSILSPITKGSDEKVILRTVGGAVVEEVRTIFEKRNDATIYIPDMQSITVLG
jgi:DNA invertase Pin-like site-specific DNA recombinase